jgi:hypothetical protein
LQLLGNGIVARVLIKELRILLKFMPFLVLLLQLRPKRVDLQLNLFNFLWELLTNAFFNFLAKLVERAFES